MLFQDKTFENIMRDCLDAAPEGVDVRQGSIFYDAVAGTALKISQFYADLSTLFDLVFLTTSASEYLDRRGQEFNVWRNPATRALYAYTYSGARTPQIGERFFQDGLFFTLRVDPEIWPTPFLEAEIAGLGSNHIEIGSKATPMINMPQPSTSTFGDRIKPGADEESDENYRRRIMEKIAGPAENGNRQHYKTWCESVAGVGRARIVPLFAGPNTVMAVLLDAEGMPASETLIGRVQDYIDPITDGLMTALSFEGETIKQPALDASGQEIVVGSGLGDAKASIGAHFAAVAPEVVTLNLTFDGELVIGANQEAIIADAVVSLTSYLKDLNLNTPENSPIVIRVSVISAILHNLDGLVDYSNLMLNGEATNITLTVNQIAVLGEVTLNAYL